MKNIYNIHTHRIEPDTPDYNIKYILNTSPEDFYAKKEQYPHTWFSCGIHPWHSEINSSQFETLLEIIKNQSVVAIGEAGLDKLKGPEIDIQVEVFRKQIELAIQYDKPMIIHCVKAWDELIALHREYKPNLPWIIHGFRGNADQVRQLTREGFKFSIGEQFNREALRHIPLDNLYCETDMSDIPICKVYGMVCDCIGSEMNQFVEKIEDNVLHGLKLLSK